MPKFVNHQRTIFLDRDGVINKKMPEGDYVKNWDEFEFLPGAVEALKLLQDNDFKILIVTNQRGIVRGLMSEADLINIHQKMQLELESRGVVLLGIYYCPHDKNECDCRKPKPGLFFRAAQEHSIDLTKAWFVGDSESDREAGERAGCHIYLISPNSGLLMAVKSILKQ